ncbi:MAG: hypothetical protein LIO44_07235 [Eubacterium sp.]|nr:hypothetical protein [Eubacterium sp.]
MKFNYHFEPKTWYRFAFEVNPKENTMSFYVGGDIILENYVLPLTVYAMGPGLYAVSSNENAVVGIDNYTYISRNYDSGSEYVVYPFTGDADSSGALTANDAAVILAKVLNGDFTMAVERDNSDGIDYVYKVDADGDGVLTANDAAMILRRVLDSAYVLPGEEVTIVVESTTETTTETTTESTTEATNQTTTESSTETTTETPTEITTYFIPMDEPTTEFYLDWVRDEDEETGILMTRVLEQAVTKETFL